MTGQTLGLGPLRARAGRLAYPIPDALLALIFALAAAADFLPSIPPAIHALSDELIYLLLAEGGFVFMQGTLIDIASRLKKRPPWWLIPFIVGGVVLFVGATTGAWEVLKVAWARGGAVFIPLLLSVLERGYVLWHLPTRTRTEKIAERALISNRITTALGLAGVMVAVIAVATIGDMTLGGTGAWTMLLAGAIYFGVAAYDGARVRRPAFAAKPRVLFRYDVIGIDYLEPL